ncbi:MAG: hypothetical protein ABTB30_07625 [Clostridia bacterium]
MKKILGILVAALILLSCAAVAETAESVEMQTGKYAIINSTGEDVVMISITDNNNPEMTTKEEYSNGLPNGTGTYFEFSIPASEDGSHRLTLAFETKSGYKGTFETLSIEEAGITLLAQDALTGATPIAFSALPQMGIYYVVNKTGEDIAKISMATNATKEPEAYEIDFEKGEFPDGETIEFGYSIAADEEPSHALTFAFETVSGYKAEFKTLSIEEVTITLLAKDAMTGATPIAFGPAPAAEAE